MEYITHQTTVKKSLLSFGQCPNVTDIVKPIKQLFTKFRQLQRLFPSKCLSSKFLNYEMYE